MSVNRKSLVYSKGKTQKGLITVQTLVFTITDPPPGRRSQSSVSVSLLLPWWRCDHVGAFTTRITSPTEAVIFIRTMRSIENTYIGR